MESNKNLKPFITKNENDKGQRKKKNWEQNVKNKTDPMTGHII